MSEQQRPQYEVLAIKAKQSFLAVCDEKTWNKEIVFALQAIRKSDALQAVAEKNPQSITNAVVNIALTGATLNPALQMAFLIPRTVDGLPTCCLDFSYRGFCNVAVSSGGVVDMDADCVFDNDFFYYERGAEPKLQHVPFAMRNDKPEGETKGKFKFVYATALIPDGNGKNIVKFIVLDKEEVEKVRKSSKQPNGPMWRDWYEEGARKTAIKKLYKLLPQTDRMSQAVAIVNEHEGIEKGSPGSAAADLMDRFGFREEPEDAEVREAGPDLCPECQKVRIMGKCHNPQCPEGEPPPTE
jgi:recombination protein RecT